MIFGQHIDPFPVKADEKGHKSAAVQGNIKGEGVYFAMPAENPGEQDKMSGTADRKELGYPLNNTEHNGLQNLGIHINLRKWYEHRIQYQTAKNELVQHDDMDI
jgi:hypothetical protein